MKILLIEPPISPYDVPTGNFALPEPLSLEIIAATVPDHEVRILDMRIDGALAQELVNYQPDLVGITSVSANLHLAMNVLKEVKETDSQIATVIGGHHASLAPRDCFSGAVDYVVIGEGERTFPELVRAISKGKPGSEVDGLAYRDNDGYRFTRERELIDINTMPIAARALTARYRRKYFRGSWHPIAHIVSSRGCPFRCEFCAEWKINKGKYRVRAPHLIVQELSQMGERHVSFIDDNTLEDVRAASEMAERIKAEGIDKVYEVFGRADTIVKHPEVVEKWRDIGLKLILIGLEALQEERLHGWNKHINLKTNEEAISVLQANGIEIAAYFIIDPSFEERDFEDLLGYIERRKLTHPIFTILTPFPGTELRQKRASELQLQSYKILDFFHAVFPTQLPLETFYEQFAGLYFKSYSARKTLAHAFKSRAFLSPRTIAKKMRFNRKLKGLLSHHAEVLRQEHRMP